VAHDPNDPRTWPNATIVIRGGTRNVGHLANVMTRDGSWSVISEPGVAFQVLAASIRNTTLRRTSVQRVLVAGGRLVPTRSDDAPPFHWDCSA